VDIANKSLTNSINTHFTKAGQGTTKSKGPPNLMCRMGIVEVIFRSTHDTHDRIEDTELSGSKRADHHTPRDETDRA
jgi:hypothetical protein